MRATNHTYYPALDGLRALAVLLVASFHVDGAGTFSPLHGGIGVTMFFVLSGFLITTLLLKEQREFSRVDMCAFYIRRSFRIFPIYYVVLAAYFLLVVVLKVDPRAEVFMEALPFYLTYLQEIPHFFFSDATGGAPFRISWSLGIEEKFYLLFPPFAFFVLRTGRQRLIGTASIAVLCVLANLWQPWGRLVAPYAFILFGCVLAIGKVEYPEHFHALQRHWVSAAALLLCFVFATKLENVLTGLAAVGILPALLTPTAGLPRLLASRPMAWLGRISYAFYLTHQLGLHAARRLLPLAPGVAHDIAVFVLGVAISIAGAWALHIAVEKPLISIGRRLARRRLVVAAPPVAAS